MYSPSLYFIFYFFFFQAEDGIRDIGVTGVQTCAFFFSSRRRHTRYWRDWSSDVCFFRSLSWAQYLGDDSHRLVDAFQKSFAAQHLVFSFGGIGATPDDHTRQCAATALGVGLRLHSEAEREIRGRFGGETTPQRLQMGEFPEGAQIIPNTVNRIPGFSLRDHHFVPGFPQMAWPMVESVLDSRYRHLFNRDRWSEASILVYEAG